MALFADRSSSCFLYRASNVTVDCCDACIPQCVRCMKSQLRISNHTCCRVFFRSNLFVETCFAKSANSFEEFIWIGTFFGRF